MKNILVLLLLMLGSVFYSGGQNSKPIFSSNSDVSFDEYTAGVKYAEIVLSFTNQEQVDKEEGIAPLYYLAQHYLMEIGFEYVALTSAEKTQMEMSVKSYCDFTSVMFGGDISKNSISNMTITFVSCIGDIYSFQSQKKFTYGKFTDIEKKLVEDWKRIVNKKRSFDPQFQFKLPSNPTSWNTANIKQYYNENAANLKPVEGMYERVRLSFEDLSGGKYTVGVVKNPDADEYMLIYLSGAINSKDWRTGELKGILHKTSTQGFYSVDWISRDKSLHEDVYCNIDETGITFYSSGVIPLYYKFIKIYPVKD
ncbi:MAG: hypothetical protein HKN92_01690 [Chitinophagales bacterium]|nr:hypothetical protein [Chitinophagales bacterium]